MHARMMNLVAFTLLMASLVAAGIFSPSPSHHNTEKTIIKEGHRVVVVEYDQDGHHNTKISIAPDPLQPHDDKFTDGGDYSGGIIGNAKDKIKEAASVLPNVGQGLSQDSHDGGAFLHAPKELVCDAYGKCKHKIAGAMGKAKETAQEAREVGETVADAVGKAKDTVSHKARDVQEKAKDTLREAKDSGKTLGNDVAGNVSEAVKNVASYLWSRETVDYVMSMGNLMGFATAYGLCVWVTFISSYVLSRAMPRQQFGVVQSKIYPVYFRVLGYSIGLALLGHVLRHRKRMMFLSKAEMLQTYNLLASLFTVFVNSVYLEPRATKVMFERMKIEKEEGRGRADFTTEPGSRAAGHHHTAAATNSTTATTGVDNAATRSPAPAPAREAEHDAVRYRIIRLNEKLKRLNSYSSLLNILNLMSLTWHLVYLAQHLHLTC